jgi:ribosomal protein L16 Arg81 hydroxylase
LSSYGDYIVRLSSANSYSYEKKDMTFREYCNKHLFPQNRNTLGNETFYMFGDNDNEEWGDLLNEYKIPDYNLPRHIPALSFGVAGPGSGVPFHFHGPGFAEAIHGRKRWFLTKPDEKPAFHPNKTTLQWYFEDYPTVRNQMELYECTIRPGEAIYFPDKWWHATLNLDTSVFISTFLSP